VKTFEQDDQGKMYLFCLLGNMYVINKKILSLNKIYTSSTSCSNVFTPTSLFMYSIELLGNMFYFLCIVVVSFCYLIHHTQQFIVASSLNRYFYIAIPNFNTTKIQYIV